MPQSPFPIYGFAPGAGVNVKIVGKNLTTGEEQTIYSASDSSFLIDAANFTSEYNSELGDIIRITAPDLNLYNEIVIDVNLYPDGVAISLTKPVTIASIISRQILSSLGGKYPALIDTFQGMPGAVYGRNSGIG